MSEKNRSIGWFELIAACVATCVVSIALSYALFQYELGHSRYQPLVLDFRGIARAHFAKIREDAAKEENPEQVQEMYRRGGEVLDELLLGLARRGYVVLERSQALAYPEELDVTQTIAAKLGIKNPGTAQSAGK